jgi:hypothetical protein
MNTLIRQLLEPIRSIKDQPFHFAAWWLVANVIGLAGFWLPLLLLHGSGKPTYLVFERLINAGTLASFSVVIIADGIAATLVTSGAGSNLTALGMRALITIIAFLLALIQIGVITFEHTAMGDSHVFVSFHLILTSLAIVFATYLYCFRFPSWEKSVAEMKREEDQEVSDLGKAAESKSVDAKGVRL